jgi:hypothetical protein
MPGILAADRSGAIVDKSERRCVATFIVVQGQPVGYPTSKNAVGPQYAK